MCCAWHLCLLLLSVIDTHDFLDQRDLTQHALPQRYPTCGRWMREGRVGVARGGGERLRVLVDVITCVNEREKGARTNSQSLTTRSVATRAAYRGRPILHAQPQRRNAKACLTARRAGAVTWLTKDRLPVCHTYRMLTRTRKQRKRVDGEPTRVGSHPRTLDRGR